MNKNLAVAVSVTAIIAASAVLAAYWPGALSSEGITVEGGVTLSESVGTLTIWSYEPDVTLAGFEETVQVILCA